MYRGFGFGQGRWISAPSVPVPRQEMRRRSWDRDAATEVLGQGKSYPPPVLVQSDRLRGGRLPRKKAAMTTSAVALRQTLGGLIFSNTGCEQVMRTVAGNVGRAFRRGCLRLLGRSDLLRRAGAERTWGGRFGFSVGASYFGCETGLTGTHGCREQGRTGEPGYRQQRLRGVSNVGERGFVLGRGSGAIMGAGVSRAGATRGPCRQHCCPCPSHIFSVGTPLLIRKRRAARGSRLQRQACDTTWSGAFGRGRRHQRRPRHNSGRRIWPGHSLSSLGQQIQPPTDGEKAATSTSSRCQPRIGLPRTAAVQSRFGRPRPAALQVDPALLAPFPPVVALTPRSPLPASLPPDPIWYAWRPCCRPLTAALYLHPTSASLGPGALWRRIWVGHSDFLSEAPRRTLGRRI